RRRRHDGGACRRDPRVRLDRRRRARHPPHDRPRRGHRDERSARSREAAHRAMSARRYVLALDQGTTGSTTLVVDLEGRVLARGYAELPQYYPQPGWVEHDPEETWSTVERSARAAMAEARVTVHEIAAVGITNQRETTIVWDRATGISVHRAIVWQCRRTASMCDRLRADGV